VQHTVARKNAFAECDRIHRVSTATPAKRNELAEGIRKNRRERLSFQLRPVAEAKAIYRDQATSP
jgi:hypothetical protein